MNPWERYATAGAGQQPAGPWARYSAPSAPAGPTPEQIERERLQAMQIADMGTGLVGAANKSAVAMGRGFMDVGQGVKQLGLGIGEWLGMVPEGRQAEYTAQVSDELAGYEPLRKDSPILTGAHRIVGNIAALPIPAGGAATVGGRVAQAATAGALQGGAQFVPEGGSRLQNAALGAVVGGAIPAVVAGTKLTIGNVKEYAKLLKASMPNVSQAARERAAAQMIRDAAANPANLSRAAQSTAIVPGTVQTLAEATDDAGIAGLQRVMASMDQQGFGGKLSQMGQQNNTARVDALRGAFGGADEAGAVTIEAARNKATLPLLAAAKKVKGVDIKPTIVLANRILKTREGNDTVVGVVSRIRDILGREGMDTVEKLHNARQEIGNVLSGQSDNTQAGRAAMNELLAIRKSLDHQIGKASPEFREFLKQYAGMSTEAGRVRMGAELLGKSAPNLDAVGNPILSPAKFANAANDLDRVAKAATGFRKETADRLMTPAQRQTVGAVRADLDRVARMTNARPAGSPTAANQAGAVRLQDSALGGDMTRPLMPTGLAGPIAWLDSIRKHYGNKTLGVVQEAMLDPNRATQILARLPPQQRVQAMTLLEDPDFLKVFESIQTGAPSALSAAAVSGNR